jgi:hypothetical protein
MWGKVSIKQLKKLSHKERQAQMVAFLRARVFLSSIWALGKPEDLKNSID